MWVQYATYKGGAMATSTSGQAMANAAQRFFFFTLKWIKALTIDSFAVSLHALVNR